MSLTSATATMTLLLEQITVAEAAELSFSTQLEALQSQGDLERPSWAVGTARSGPPAWLHWHSQEPTVPLARHVAVDDGNSTMTFAYASMRLEQFVLGGEPRITVRKSVEGKHEETILFLRPCEARNIAHYLTLLCDVADQERA